MLLTITLVLVAMLALAALELWLFCRLGDRDDRRRTHGMRGARSSTAWIGARDTVPRWRRSSPVKPATCTVAAICRRLPARSSPAIGRATRVSSRTSTTKAPN
jgi:hypothetical protein